MRSALPLILAAAGSVVVAGCGSSSNASDMQASAGADMTVPACAQTLDAFCSARGDCKRDLAAAQQPSSWCGDGGTGVSSVTVQHCAGNQTVIVASYVDSADHYVYAGSTLVAVFSSLPHATTTLSCVAGPSTFPIPTGCDAGTALCS